MVTIALIGYSLYEWLSNDLYAANKPASLVYLLCMYLLAIVIYVSATPAG